MPALRFGGAPAVFLMTIEKGAFMMKHFYSAFGGLLCFLGITLCLAACDDTERFTTDTGAVLAFSSDSIKFDTVITTIGSSTRSLKVYNRNDRGVRISRVWLEKGSATCFRVNVDGVFLAPSSGASVSGLELYGSDSLMVFAEVTIPEKNQNEPFEMTDRLCFQLESGVVQAVTLQAIGQDAYLWKGKVIAQDTILSAGRPYLIYDSLSVAEGARLTLNAGVQLYFHDKADLLVHGQLLAEGTLDAPVVFRGDRTDNLFDYLPYDNTPSRWGGVRFFAGSKGNILRYADIHSASYGILCDSSSVEDSKLLLENSILHNIGGDGLKAINCNLTVGNTQISNTLGNCVYLIGGSSEFIHCTLAQFYPWEAVRGQALYLSDNYFSASVSLVKAHFYNCLITGYADDVILGSLEEKEQKYDYLFANSLLNTPAVTDDPRYRNCLFEPDQKEKYCIREKGFVKFDTKNYLYDFAPDSCSAALQLADTVYSLRYPFDRRGVSRFAGVRPAAGCYEYVPQKQKE